MSREEEQQQPAQVQGANQEEQKLNEDTQREYGTQQNQGIGGQLVQKGDETVNKVNTLTQFKGNPVQLAQQNALMVLALQYAIASLLAMFIIQVEPLAWLIKVVPKLDWISLIVFGLVLLMAQFGWKLFERPPWNFLLFLLHFVTKVLILVFSTVWLFEQRLELYWVFFVTLIAYVLFSVKEVAGGADVDLSVKGNFFKIVFYAIIVALFLVMLTRARIVTLLLMTVVGVIYACFLLLAVQRFSEFEFMQHDNNGVYLGAAQMDADLVIFCPFAFFHLKSHVKQHDELKDEEKGQQQ